MAVAFSRRGVGEHDAFDDDEHLGIVRRSASTKPGGRWEAVLPDGKVLDGEYLTRRAAATALQEAGKG